MGRKRRPRKVYQEEAKQRQVSHWDMDYLPQREIDKVASPSTPEATDAKGASEAGLHESWGSRFLHALGRLFGGAR